MPRAHSVPGMEDNPTDATEPRDGQPRDGEEYVPTTTHAEWGAGNPRLIVTSEQDRMTFDIASDLTRIGSAGDADLLLAGADPLHATIRHDERDEYVLTLHGEGEMNANPDTAATVEGDRSETLRTGARFTAGPWSLVFMRDEYADHGRPFGGREGGEGTHQPMQPQRPDYERDPNAEEPRPLEVRDD